MVRTMIAAPPVTPLPYGLFSAARVLDETGPSRFMLNGVSWEPLACSGEVNETAGACLAADDLEAPGDGVPLVEGGPFALYHLHKCRILGGYANAAERARAALALGEQRGAEHYLARALASRGTVTRVGTGTVTPTVGLALLEEYAADVYGGVPVIHTPRVVGSLLASRGALVRGNGRLETVQGAAVSSGGGYGRLFNPETGLDDGYNPTAVLGDLTAPAAGTAWVYVTGAVGITRDAVASVGPELGGEYRQNEFTSMVQRGYAVGWECFTAAVLVSVTDTISIDGGSA